MAIHPGQAVTECIKEIGTTGKGHCQLCVFSFLVLMLLWSVAGCPRVIVTFAHHPFLTGKMSTDVVSQ